MNADFDVKTAIELSRAVAARLVSPVELMQACLARVGRLDPRLNCFATYEPELAMAAARRAAQAVMAGDRLGPLNGLPLSIKGLIAVKDMRFAFGSRAMADGVGITDAPSVERIRAADACIIGKSTTSEFGRKAVGDSPLTGITRNPWNLDKTPGTATELPVYGRYESAAPGRCVAFMSPGAGFARSSSLTSLHTAARHSAPATTAACGPSMHSQVAMVVAVEAAG